MGAAMNREDIERMARAAQGHAYTNRYTPGETAFAFSIDRLENFVAMVAAAEREKVLLMVDEMRGSEQGRNAMFSEGYDYAMHQVETFVKGLT
jgi:hypothetical protein